MKAVPNFDMVEKDQYVLVNTSSAPEIYADGVSALLVGYPMMKIMLHSVLQGEDENGRERRKAVALLTMDTYSALELALEILDVCKTNEAALLESANFVSPLRLKTYLDRISETASKVSSGDKTERKTAVKAKPKKNDL